MQFVRHGPDIPERLLQAHEDGRVVFFCGAGISYPARLPGFAGLVEKVYETLATAPNAGSLACASYPKIPDNCAGRGRCASRGYRGPQPTPLRQHRHRRCVRGFCLDRIRGFGNRQRGLRIHGHGGCRG